MFAVIYRWQVVPGLEAQFEAGWRRGTERIAAEFGGWGSRLHAAGDGIYIAYAQWPDEPTWQKAMDNHMRYDEPETRRKFVEALAKPETADDLVFAMPVTDDVLDHIPGV